MVHLYLRIGICTTGASAKYILRDLSSSKSGESYEHYMFTSEPWPRTVESLIASWDSLKSSHESVWHSSESVIQNDSLSLHVNIVFSMTHTKCRSEPLCLCLAFAAEHTSAANACFTYSLSKVEYVYHMVHLYLGICISIYHYYYYHYWCCMRSSCRSIVCPRPLSVRLSVVAPAPATQQQQQQQHNNKNSKRSPIDLMLSLLQQSSIV